MTREQAINSMISHGFKVEQVGEIIKAVTDKPTTKNDSSELEKNSKKLEKDFGELDCISKADALDCVNWGYSFSDIYKKINELPSVTPQLSVPEVTALAEWTEKLTKASEDAYNKGYADGMKEQEPILDKLRAEMEKLRPNLRPEQMTDYDYAMVDVVNDIVVILDKYKTEGEKA